MTSPTSSTETLKNRNPPLPSEEVHLPGPHPARGIYGFALYIVSWCLLIIYLIWAITPVPILYRLGITYIPSKLWAIAIGIFFPSAACLYVTKTLNNTKKLKYNRSAQVGEIQKRWAEYVREQLNKMEDESASKRYSTESLLGEMLLSQEADYDKILAKRKPNKPLTETVSSSPSTSFPLKSMDITYSNGPSSSESSFGKPRVQDSEDDRGFYVEADVFVDEYVAGSTLDLDPGDKMVATREYYGSEDAVEQISFQKPGQRMAGVEENEQKSSPHSSDNFDDPETSTMTGTIVEDMPSSSNKCTGCGANFHCKDSSLPGFVPLEILEKIDRKSSKYKRSEAPIQSLCKRCHLLQDHNFLLNVNVCDVDYSRMMSELRKQPESLVVLVVDVTDLPGSIYPKLAQVVGSRRPMIVVGNKVDLLPPDARTGYMYRFKKTVERAVEKAGLLENFNILHTALVSAKTGYGIEELITEIYLKYTNVKLGMRGDIFLVGCTNAGKSTMFNALLQSDLCKVRAVDLVDRATTSIWPGTTISLLKFPVMKPGPYRLEMRRRRLLAHRAWVKKEMYARKLLLAETGDDRYAIPISVIQNTYKDSEEELQTMALKELQREEEEDDEMNRRNEEKINIHWMILSSQKENVLSLFTLDELVNVIPRRVLKPRTALVKYGESLLIGGVSRVDIESIDGYSNVLLTTFANEQLPLNVVPTHEVEEFYRKWLGTPALVVPQGDQMRMASWPGFNNENNESGRRFEMKGRRDEGCCDIVLSSIGWVMVTSEKDVILKAFTPANKGITARVQPILPYSASLRGKRLPGSQFYKVQPIEFPVNVKRKRAEARKRAEKKREKETSHDS
uniref:G domain-containing protein n=3 Tax=Caenorhabditis tropicalis TaxID=1561998 RepID=A0A1I7UUE9_9PELO